MKKIRLDINYERAFACLITVLTGNKENSLKRTSTEELTLIVNPSCPQRMAVKGKWPFKATSLPLVKNKVLICFNYKYGGSHIVCLPSLCLHDFILHSERGDK